MTGNIQVKDGKYYLILNLHENGKRKQKWISTNLDVKGNKRNAEKLLRETLAKYEAESGHPKRQRKTRKNPDGLFPCCRFR